MRFLIKILVTGLAVLVSAYLLPGVTVDNMITAIGVAAVLAVLNAFVKPVLIILTLPITIFSLGLFLLVINAFMIMLAGKFVPGFTVDGFWYALLFSIVLSIINSLFEASNPENKRPG
ncbi:membrane protein [Bacteroidota bacterium]|nr:membrane protein [Bacteroidota bacterium]